MSIFTKSKVQFEATVHELRDDAIAAGRSAVVLFEDVKADLLAAAEKHAGVIEKAQSKIGALKAELIELEALVVSARVDKAKVEQQVKAVESIVAPLAPESPASS